MTHTVEITKRYTSWSRQEPSREWTALQLLAPSGLTPVPLATSGTPPADPSFPLRPWVSMSIVPGTPFEGSLTTAQLDALGDALATLWSVPPTGLLLIDLSALLARTKAGLSGLKTGVIGKAASAWLASDAQVPALTDPVLAHGDPNLANYLWDGKRVRIVDFEDSGIGDRTVELANLVEHLSGRATDWTPLLARFPVDKDRFTAARCLWAAFWLTLVCPGGPSEHRNPPGTGELQAERLLKLLAAARADRHPPES